ncbi:MAG: alanine racemase [Puniceicoccales bacterium]|jgi:alanine racemase|nr:alanine racemase [Puniceicoccales bacterium]
MPSSTPVDTRALRAWAEIDLGALERNLTRIRRRLPAHVRYIAVVKADAYGHGLPAIVSRMLKSGIDAFGVANVQEGVRIREQGIALPVLLLSPVLPAEVPSLFEHHLIPFVSSLEELRHLRLRAQVHGEAISVHLKVDTGMGRAGFWHEEPVEEALRTFETDPWLRITGIATHFSCAGSDWAHTELQRRRFGHWLKRYEKACGLLSPELWVHESASFSLPKTWENSPGNAVRIGALQYGVGPDEQLPFVRSLALEPVLSFYTRVSLLKTLPAGVPIGYDAMATTERTTRIAVLGAGYADGISTHASNVAEVLIHGQRFQVLGRVAMDQILLDVTEAKMPLQVGDRVTWIGRDGEDEITANEFCRCSQRLIRECLCSISARVRRVYIG